MAAEGVSTAEAAEAAFMVAAVRAWAEAAATTEASVVHAVVSAADLAAVSAALMAVRRQARAASANAMALAAISAAVCGVPDLARVWVQRSTHGAGTPPLIPVSPTGTGTALAGLLAQLALPGAASERGLARARALARA